MKYTLMHKNIKVLNFVLDEATGNINEVDEIYNVEHRPVGVVYKKNIIDRATLNEWWSDRCIPSSRSGLKEALEVLNISNTKLLLSKGMGLSLSDHYWIKPVDEKLRWEDVNFFENDFSEDIGNILFGKGGSKKKFDFSSPDNTSDGFLKKRWKIIDGMRVLVKAGSLPFMQQPFNEVIASIIMDKLGITHVAYKVIWEDEMPYSICEDFVDTETELVSAWRVMKLLKKDNSTSVYQHFVNCSKKLGINNIERRLDEMIVVDYIIGNEDRHQNNFGLIRNSETLEWVGFAPIYDSGSSCGYDRLSDEILNGYAMECKPFKKTHEEQIKLVKSFSWIDFEKLESADKDIREVLNGAGKYIDGARREAILTSIMGRIEKLKSIAKLEITSFDNIDSDVLEDKSREY